jgi:hypothetical protein
MRNIYQMAGVCISWTFASYRLNGYRYQRRTYK